MEVRNAAAAIDPKQSADAVGLLYVSDRSPGIRRVGNPKKFGYIHDSTGKPVRNRAQLNRIKSLAIPPAWKNVWICPKENGHLQAVGVDARGRKQYRYHKRWREIRDETKYNRMILFGKALPRIRQRVAKDLRDDGLPRHKVLATVVRLMDTNFIRIGNEEYARTNKSYGLTTMKDKHAEVNGSKINFKFRGKGAKEHIIDVHDPHLAAIVKKCQDLPGQELFQFVNGDNKVQDVKSEDVNAYLREISGEDFTAKDFRTWAGTVLAAHELCSLTPSGNSKQTKRILTQAVEAVASKLGNTPAVCRKSYVHPVIFETYQNGKIAAAMAIPLRGKSTPKHDLSSEEKCVLRLLKKQVAEQQEPLETRLQKSLSELKLKRGRRGSVR